MDRIMRKILFLSFAFMSFFPILLLARTNADVFQLRIPDTAEQIRKNKWRGAVISVVLNQCKKNIELAADHKREIIHPGKSSLKHLLRIPFASMKEYLKEIIEDVPYVPKHALKVKTPEGTYGLWEDERGIQYCLVEKKPLEEQIVQKLIGKRELASALSLTLLIGEKGLLDLSTNE